MEAWGTPKYNHHSSVPTFPIREAIVAGANSGREAFIRLYINDDDQKNLISRKMLIKPEAGQGMGMAHSKHKTGGDILVAIGTKDVTILPAKAKHVPVANSAVKPGPPAAAAAAAPVAAGPKIDMSKKPKWCDEYSYNFVAWVNFFREKPAELSKVLTARLTKYDANGVLTVDGSNVKILTKEGKAGCQAAIDFLKNKTA